jgi:hypothetical protein
VKEAAKGLGRDLLGANVGYRSDLSTTEYVTRLYQTFLRRAPDSGLSGYVTQADTNGRSSVLEAFLSMSAYSERSGALYREIFWLISDHLGTTRMIAERTGSLAGIKRHDYLPFGESANSLGGRATMQGYVAESVRQGFTGYEEDAETGLDYAQARRFSSEQGRWFTRSWQARIELIRRVSIVMPTRSTINSPTLTRRICPCSKAAFCATRASRG